MATQNLRERLGERIGAIWAPAIDRIARARHARMFHPEGIVTGGVIEPVAGDRLGARFSGPTIARWSGALWKRAEAFDVLGVALRIRRHDRALDAIAADDDQDLLFATIRSPFTIPLSPLTTRSHDFLANRYYAVSPFEIEPLEHIKLRLTPVDPPTDTAGPREVRLEAALAAGRADLWLEIRPTFMLGYRRIARVRLDRVLSLDQEALRFDPFRDGRGIVPSGLIHAIRRRAYPASRHGTAAAR
jgi:hypothetical protein